MIFLCGSLLPTAAWQDTIPQSISSAIQEDPWDYQA